MREIPASYRMGIGRRFSCRLMPRRHTRLRSVDVTVFAPATPLLPLYASPLRHTLMLPCQIRAKSASVRVMPAVYAAAVVFIIDYARHSAAAQ